MDPELMQALLVSELLGQRQGDQRQGDAINRKLYMDNDEAMDPELLHTDIDIDDDDGDDNAFGSIAADTVNDFEKEYPMREARAACAATNAFISRVTRPLSDAAVHPNQRG